MKRDRSRSIGGSDIGVIMGVSHYNTPVELWMEKTGRKPRDEVDDLAKRMGHYMEPFILDLYEECHEVKLNRLMSPTGEKEIHHTWVDYLVVEYDAIDETNGVVVDAKNKSLSAFFSGFGNRDLQQVPRDIMCQLQLYMWAAGLKKGCVAVKYDSFMYCEYPLTRNDQLIDEMLDAADRFWWCVQNDKAPVPTTYRESMLLWQPEKKEYSIASDIEEEAFLKYKFLDKKIAELSQQQEEQKKILADRVAKDRTQGIMLGGKKIFTCSVGKKGVKSGRVNIGKEE